MVRSHAVRAALVLSAAFATVACADGELLVHVEPAGDGVEDVDRLQIEVYEDERATPTHQSRTESFSGLPQSFLVTSNGATADVRVRIRVTGESEGTPVAAGDVVAEVPSSGRDDVTVRILSECRSVVCPRLQSCVLRDEVATCDGRCGGEAECSGLLGCASGATCAPTAEGDVCTGMGADSDGDGLRDARCATDPERAVAARIDCDDTSAEARPNGDRVCGRARDHDCDGINDDDQLCASVCTPLDSIGIGTAEIIAAPDAISSIGALRGEAAQRQLFVAMGSTVRSFSVPGGGAITMISELSVAAPRGVAVLGPLLAVATEQGLVLASIAADGMLTQIGMPFAVPPESPVALTSVELNDDTAWVSGEGDLALAAIDVRNPDIPRFLGHVAGPAATRLERVDDGILATTADPARRIVLYGAPVRGAPTEGIPLADMLDLSDMEIAGIGVQRKASGLPEVIGVGVGNAFRIYERIGSSIFELRATDSTSGAVEAMYFDRGVFLYGTASGVAGGYVRSGVAGTVVPTSDDQTTIGAPTTPPLFSISTTATGGPRVVMSSGSTIWIAPITCGM